MPKQPKRKFHQYSEENMQKALEAFRNGAKKRKVCRDYRIPRSTLQDRIREGKFLNEPIKMGPNPYLSVENEKKIVNWITNLAKCGFPLKKNELIRTVQKIVVEGQIKTPFKDGKPGQKWYSSFLRRNPEISKRTAEAVTKSRAKLTEEYIKTWFKELENFLEGIGASDVLKYPSRIFNADESGFSLCPKTGKVLGPRGYNSLYEIKKGNEKDNITVLVTFSADGSLCPPCVIYPYVKPPKVIVESMPSEWILGKSESGWMRSDVFYEYVANGFHEWILERNIKKPIIFFVDGHRSHMSIELSQFCDNNNIILYALPPNATHLMQPADVAVFKPLKEYWRQAVRSWQAANVEKTLNKPYFAPVFEQALSNPKICDHIKSGFKRCGLFPYDPEAVDYSKCVQNTLENVQPAKQPEVSEVPNLTAADFESTYKVINNLKSNFIERTLDIDQLLDDLKTFQQNILQNKSDDNAIIDDGDNIDINEYVVNGDGSLRPIQNNEREMEHYEADEPNVNILRVDVVHPTSISLGQNTENELLLNNEKVNIDDSNNFSKTPGEQNKENEFLPIINITKNSQINVDVRSGSLKEFNEDFLPATISVKENRQNKIGIFKSFNLFDKHLKYPKPLEKSKKPKSGPSTSAISAKAWRSYFIEKENEKKEKEIEKKRKQEKSQRNKSEKLLKTKKQNSKKNSSESMVDTAQGLEAEFARKKQKCGVCDEELDSDAEEDAEKNVGCDMCPRWFHLNCTTLSGQKYEEVINEDFFCDFCSEND